MVLRPGDGEELDRDVPLWRKPEGRVTSGGARREAGGVAYLGQDKPRGWSWVPRAARMGTDQALWSCWLHRLWFSWFHPEVFLRGKVLTKALSTHQAGRKQMLLPPGQRRRAVCSCYLLFWRWGDARALVPCPSCRCYRRCRSAASSSQCGVTGLLCFDGYILKYLVADYAKYLLFITASFCVNAVSSLQYGFNISWILYVNCFQFSIASSLGPLQLNYCYSCPFVKCVMPVLIFLLGFI